MNRRIFLKNSCSAFCVFACPYPLFSVSGQKVRFGLVTDLHYAERKNKGNRFYDQSQDKLTDAVNFFNNKKVDFIVELGDFKDQGDPPDKEQTIAFLDKIEKTFSDFNGPAYHVLGNHDMDSISKSDFLKHTRNAGDAKGKNYYSFIRDGIRFIVLDANYNEDGSDYDSGNFDWTYAMVPDEEKEWLKSELDKDNLPVIVFTHQLLDSFSGISKLVCVKNAEEIVDILEKSNRVLAVFQGHHHHGNYSFRNGIHYFTMKAMVEGELSENNSYAIIEIDEGLNITVAGFGNCEDKLLKCHYSKSFF